MNTCLNEKNICIISTYPPGYGGVSIHTKNLINLLSESGKYELNFFRLNQSITGLLYSFLIFLINIKKYEKIHLHTSFFSNKTIFLLFLIFFAKQENQRILISIHDGQAYTRYHNMFFLKKEIIKRMVRKAGKIVMMNIDDRKLFKHCLNLKDEQITAISPYIPQIPRPTVVKKSINDSINIITIIQYSPIYGVEGIIELCKTLVFDTKFKVILTIVSTSNEKNSTYYRSVITLLKNDNLLASGLKINHLEDLKHEELQQLFRENHFLIRNTSFDSFGLSIAEAIDNGVICYATNVCERYPGTNLYAQNDYGFVLESLKEKIAGYNRSQEHDDFFVEFDEQVYHNLYN